MEKIKKRQMQSFSSLRLAWHLWHFQGTIVHMHCFVFVKYKEEEKNNRNMIQSQSEIKLNHKSVSENLVSYLHFKALKAHIVPSKSCICTYDAQKLAAYGFDTQPWRDSSSKNVKSVIIYTPSRHSKPVRLERCQSQSPFTFIFHTAKVTKAVSH